MPTSFFPFTLSVAAVLLAGCASPDAGGPHDMAGGMGMMKGRMAMASLTPTEGNQARGLVMFHEMTDHLMVHARISGLKPDA